MEALLVLLGAVVGSIGSIAGSIIVNRRELARNARIRLYQQIVPALIDQTVSKRRDVDTSMQTLYREAVLAGRKERERADRLLELWAAQQAASSNGGGRFDDKLEGPALAAFAAANQSFLDGLLEFESHLEKRIR